MGLRRFNGLECSRDAHALEEGHGGEEERRSSGTNYAPCPYGASR